MTRGIIRGYSSPVFWMSQPQRTVAESTAEAELAAINMLAHKIVFLIHLHKKILSEDITPVEIYKNNQTAKRNCCQAVSKSRLKHLEVNYFKAAEYTEKGLIKVEQVSTKDQLADIFFDRRRYLRWTKGHWIKLMRGY